MSTLVSDLASVVTIVSLQIVTVNWTRPSALVGRAVAGLTCVAGCMMAIAAAEFQLTRASSAELASVSPRSHQAAIYILTHVCFLAVMATTVSVRYALLARAAWPRRPITATGLTITTLGALCGMVYAMGRVGTTAAHLAGAVWPPTVETHLLPVTGSLAALFVALGLTLPTIAQQIALPLRRSANGKMLKGNAVRRVVRL
ncbi:hypothetical protein [Streptomyces sp. V3I7]|uniref:hypothetical protein n=1 Tax=Streptomyces sp. V3I7 TaxID=3042278 RepID=UPI0027D8FBAA|nr:hypothetical protein [Streptomyces sp. V3I7]